MTNKTALIVDGNNNLFRAFYKFTGMRTQQGSSTSCIYGFPYIIRKVINKFKPDIAYMVFDGGKSEHRLKVLPNYKNREKKIGFDYDDFIRQKDMVMEIMYNMGCYVIQERHTETDDWIMVLTRKLKKQGYGVIILSADKDFHQLLCDGVMQYAPTKDLKITHKNVKRHYGYEANQCVDYLCIDGDSSDKIPGYPGMGEKRIADFFSKFSSINEYLASDESIKILDKKKLEVIYKRNRKLIDLSYFYRKHLRKKKIPYMFGKEPKVSIKYVSRLCRKQNINTFLEPDFLTPFKSLKHE